MDCEGGKIQLKPEKRNSVCSRLKNRSKLLLCWANLTLVKVQALNVSWVKEKEKQKFNKKTRTKKRSKKDNEQKK